MDVSGQFHAPTSFPRKIESPAPNAWELVGHRSQFGLCEEERNDWTMTEI